ncbi:tyrosine-protein phosphatase [Opitutaceae bacterium TAV4]|nr:tyrosine-protein phosphatase [Opitutaceae bacterium TAV4]RRK01134.1 tyrosine-protein phosphatase [Opitutaceae bacterium TAV3]
MAGNMSASEPCLASSVRLSALADTAATDPRRIVPLQGAVNFRDLGGYPVAAATATDEPRRVRWGRLYRAGAIHELTGADIAMLGARRVFTVLDFRESSEAAKAPDRLPAGAVRYGLCSGGHDSPDDWAHMLAKAESGVRFMCGFYAATGSLAVRYRPFFERLLALPDDHAALFHCTIGKDRTGIGAALLLGALGVSEETILTDYLLTNTCRAAIPDDAPVPGLLDGIKLHPQVTRDLLSARPEYLQSLHDSIAGAHGTLAGFLQNVLGVGPAEVAVLREKFTEPAV